MLVIRRIKDMIKVGEYVILDMSGRIVKGFGSFKTFEDAERALIIWLDKATELADTYEIILNQ